MQSSQRAPTVAFAVPGRGDEAAGNLVELEPIDVAPVGWWQNVRNGLALSDTTGKTDVDRWTGKTYTVLARYDSTGDVARVSIVDSLKHEFNIASIAGPIRRIDWLDDPSIAAVDRDALSRAFNQAARYDDATRIAAVAHRSWKEVAVVSRKPLAVSQSSHSLAARSSITRTYTCRHTCAHEKPSTRAGTKRRSS
jgi:hypothetical protein